MPPVPAGDLDRYLANDDAIAIVSSQHLRPADGDGQPFFPPTYLGGDDKPTYCISTLDDGHNFCVVDSVQSQANRVEQAFLSEPYRSLIPRVTVTAQLANGEQETLDMLQLGHRLADAAVTFSTLADNAQAAIRAFAQSSDEIARLSPMSLLCGMWESRGKTSQLKIPRAFSATITARDVQPLIRMATFGGSFWSKDLGLDGKRSEEGLDPVPSGRALGGVLASGEIKRTATLNLIALRQNCGIRSSRAPTAVADYIFGLGLVALTMPIGNFLRQGCLLVPGSELQLSVVFRDGREESLACSKEQALALADSASKAFGIPALKPIDAKFMTDRLAKEKAVRGK